ncbi:MAG: SCO family protein [Candidatus Thiodiazotropha sp.]|jgi:protein SCO1
MINRKLSINDPGRVTGLKRASLLAATLSILYPLCATALADDGAVDFKQFSVTQVDKPFSLDCASKHAKYLPASANATDGQVELASISGESGTAFTQRQALSRSSYSSKLVDYKAPDVVLIADDQNEVNLAELFTTDRPVMLNFIFTTCTTICPVLSASFEQVQTLLGEEAEEVMMVSISIDPEYDTPEKLAEYSSRFSAGSQWKFLTGQINDVISVEKAFDIYRGSKTNHEPVTYLRSGNSTEWLRIEGFASAREIVAEYYKMTSVEGS